MQNLLKVIYNTLGCYTHEQNIEFKCMNTGVYTHR